jgi:hypothetical protein
VLQNRRFDGFGPIWIDTDPTSENREPFANPTFKGQSHEKNSKLRPWDVSLGPNEEQLPGIVLFFL